MSAQSFEDVEKAIEVAHHVDKRPLVIKFSATWCGPCKKFAPEFSKFAAESADVANFLCVDVDDVNLPPEYGIKTVPCVHIWTRGSRVEVIPGSDISKVKAALDFLLVKKAESGKRKRE